MSEAPAHLQRQNSENDTIAPLHSPFGPVRTDTGFFSDGNSDGDAWRKLNILSLG